MPSSFLTSLFGVHYLFSSRIHFSAQKKPEKENMQADKINQDGNPASFCLFQARIGMDRKFKAKI
jgi:hypothetical protein